jgi:DNA-binding HxlR family transcriptional regulator
MALACDLLGDRWTMLIIREAFYGVSRFDDLQSDLGIPRGMLSDRLKKLVNLGILERRPYREGTARARAEYHLGARGADLGIPLIALMQWVTSIFNRNPCSHGSSINKQVTRYRWRSLQPMERRSRRSMCA